MSSNVELKSYDNSSYFSGRSNTWRAVWMFIGLPLFRSALLPFSGLRVRLLRIFGATVGDGVVIHSEVVVKYPWHLIVGDNCWIGERSWFDNLTTIRLGNDVCVSQGAYFCTGNHDWSLPTFDLKVGPITLQDGSWAGAMCRLLPGTVLREGAVAAAGSVVAGIVPSYEIFAGNPARFHRRRIVHVTSNRTCSTEVHAQ